MGLFGSIVGVVKKIGTTAYGIIKTALPILKALRPAVEEVDVAFDFIEAKIAQGGEAADDFLDQNLDTIRDTGAAMAQLAVVANRGKLICDKLELYSQEQTPETIDEQEALDLGEELLALKNDIAAFKTLNEAALVKLEAAAQDS